MLCQQSNMLLFILKRAKCSQKGSKQQGLNYPQAAYKTNQPSFQQITQPNKPSNYVHTSKLKRQPNEDNQSNSEDQNKAIPRFLGPNKFSFRCLVQLCPQFLATKIRYFKFWNTNFRKIYFELAVISEFQEESSTGLTSSLQTIESG